MGNFRELKVWKESMDLVELVYNLTKKKDFSRDFGLTNQIRRAVISVPSNIAEGDQLATQKQSIQYFHIARASAAEVLTQIIIAMRLNYIRKEESQIIEDKSEKIAKMLTKLIQYRKQNEKKS